MEVLSDQLVPCDLVLLYANTDNDECHVTTANLDGETNLKVKTVPKDVPPISADDFLSDLQQLRGLIQCENPNAHLYEFKGKLIIGNKEL